MLRFHQLVVAPREARLLLFSRTGFEPELRREAAGDPETELIDLDRFYLGD